MARKTIQSRLRLIVMACHFDVCETKRQLQLAFFITTGKLALVPAFVVDFIVASHSIRCLATRLEFHRVFVVDVAVLNLVCQLLMEGFLFFVFGHFQCYPCILLFHLSSIFCCVLLQSDCKSTHYLAELCVI